MAITTVPVTMRVNKQVVKLAKADAKKNETYYQTELNKRLAKSYGVKLPDNLPNKRVVAKGKKASKKKATKKPYKKSKSAKKKAQLH